MIAPIIFCHYGMSNYLRYTLLSSKLSNPDKNIYKCNHCKNATNIVQIRIPYAFKLLTQELYTMNVIMRYICNN